jgi:hypothetical protein
VATGWNHVRFRKRGFLGGRGMKPPVRAAQSAYWGLVGAIRRSVRRWPVPRVRIKVISSGLSLQPVTGRRRGWLEVLRTGGGVGRDTRAGAWPSSLSLRSSPLRGQPYLARDQRAKCSWTHNLPHDDSVQTDGHRPTESWWSGHTHNMHERTFDAAAGGSWGDVPHHSPRPRLPHRLTPGQRPEPMKVAS